MATTWRRLEWLSLLQLFTFFYSRANANASSEYNKLQSPDQSVKKKEQQRRISLNSA